MTLSSAFQDAVAACPYVTASTGSVALLCLVGLYQWRYCCKRRATPTGGPRIRTKAPIIVTCLAGLSIIAVHALLSLSSRWSLELTSPFGEPLCLVTDLCIEASFFILVMLWTATRSRMRSICGLQGLAQLALFSSANIGVWLAGLVHAASRLKGRGTTSGVLDVVVLALGLALWVLVVIGAGDERRGALVDRDDLHDLLLGTDMPLEEAPVPTAPLEDAGLLSILSISWVNRLMDVGALRQLCFDDLPPLPHKDLTERWARRFQEALAVEMEEKPSLLRAAHRTFGREYYYLGAMQLTTDLLAFSGPVLLKLIVTFVQDHQHHQPGTTGGSSGLSRGLSLLAALVACYLASAIISTQYGFRMSRVQLHIKSAIISAVYTQVLRTREAELRAMGLGAGEVTNLVTVDVNRMVDAASSFNQFWSLPIQVGITLYLLYQEVSYAFIAGLIVIGLMIPVNMVIAKAIARVTQKQMSYKDRRVRLCDEMLHGIRALKLLAWEGVHAALLGRYRTHEVKFLSQRKYLDAWCVYFWAATPVLTCLATFTSVALTTKGALTPASVFTTVSLLNMLIFPMNCYPWVINGLMEALVSKKRLERFLIIHEQQQCLQGVIGSWRKWAPPTSEAPAMVVELQGAFVWDEEKGDDSDALESPRRQYSTSQGQEEVEEGERGGEVPVEALQGTALLDAMEGGEEQQRGGGDDEREQEEEEGEEEGQELLGGGGGRGAFTLQVPWPLRIRKGEVIGIYGKVGAGKSSLLSAILGEMRAAGHRQHHHHHATTTNSVVRVRARSRAYCAQTPWVHGHTIRESVLFGSHWDPRRYDKVMFACGLSEDVKRIGNGDLGELGERGMTLSGGQRQRLALARALYGHADLYLLDDIFSGLDGATAAHVARHAVYGMMRQEGATVVLVTHAMDLLYGCDTIVGMRGGEVVTRARVVREGGRRGEEERGGMMTTMTTTSSSKASVCEAPPTAKVDSPLAEEEGREEGGVKMGVFTQYVLSMGKGVAVATLVVMLAMQLSANAFSYWLGEWARYPDKYTDKRFLITSAVIAGINSIMTFGRSFLFAYGGLRAAKVLHDTLLASILGTTISFFDATPLGRILNRFSQDTYSIDDQLPFMLNIFLAQAFALLGTAVVLVLASRWTLVILAIISIFYYRLQRYYRASSRELKRLDSVSRSPIFTHFTDTLDGASTIRAFNAGDRFLHRNLSLIDDNQKVSLMSNAASQWLAFRLQMFGLLVVTFISASAILSCLYLSHGVDAGLVGLSLSYALPIVGNLGSLLSSYAETEKELISVERVEEYIQQPREPDIVGHGEAIDPPAVWPPSGAVSVQGLSLRYRPGLPLALDNISCHIQPGEKVGLVGRTGSGKSSLMAALLRLVPWQGGSILIDGLPINRISLQRLRASLAILPQSPTLFSGTIRSNLDPKGEHTDEELCRALRACRLDAVLGMEVTSSESGGGDVCGGDDDDEDALTSCLSIEVAEKGGNFSVGQRQLLCLCRVLLRRTPIVCVDEATASLDVATDAIIRRTIAVAFRHATVITIAHRLSTVLELCTRVIVLSEGRVVEEGSPRRLLENPNSWFRMLTTEEEVLRTT